MHYFRTHLRFTRMIPAFNMICAIVKQVYVYESGSSFQKNATRISRPRLARPEALTPRAPFRISRPRLPEALTPRAPTLC